MSQLRRAGLILLAVLGLSLGPPRPPILGGAAGEIAFPGSGEPDASSASPRMWGVGGQVAWAAPDADAGSTLVVVDAPKGGNTSTQIEVRGWAADPSARGGTGVDRVEMYLDGERDAGGTRVGQATYGLQRPDVAANLGGQQFLLSGFALQTAVAPGPHTVYVYAHPSDQPANQGWTTPKQAALMAVTGAPQPGSVSSLGGGAVTLRLPNATGSVTLDLSGVGSNYPPGPADIGGPLYAPAYFGYGLYGGVQPFPDYPLAYTSGVVVPPWFDFSQGYGSNLFGVGAFTLPSYYYPNYYPGYFTVPHTPSSYYDYVLPAWRRFGWASGPVYCPIYTAVVC
jgi:hypothetical protein